MFWTRAKSFPFASTLSRQADMFNRLVGQHDQSRRIHSAPTFNLWADENGAVLTSEIPGVELGQLEITVSGRDVSVKGSRPAEPVEGAQAVRRERAAGEFERAFQLPFQVDAEKVEAKFVNGVLEVTLPRAEYDKPRKINISAS